MIFHVGGGGERGQGTEGGRGRERARALTRNVVSVADYIAGISTTAGSV